METFSRSRAHGKEVKNLGTNGKCGENSNLCDITSIATLFSLRRRLSYSLFTRKSPRDRYAAEKREYRRSYGKLRECECNHMWKHMARHENFVRDENWANWEKYRNSDFSSHINKRPRGKLMVKKTENSFSLHTQFSLLIFTFHDVSVVSKNKDCKRIVGFFRHKNLQFSSALSRRLKFDEIFIFSSSKIVKRITWNRESFLEIRNKNLKVLLCVR